MLNPWKLYPAIALLLLLLGAGIWGTAKVLGWRADAAELPKVTQQRDQALSDMAEHDRAAERERIRADKATKGYTDEVEANRRRPRPDARPVRLCVDPAPARVPAASGPAVSPDAAAPAAGELPGPAGVGPDIGPALRALADDADAVVAQCRALQSWTRGLSDPVPSHH